MQKLSAELSQVRKQLEDLHEDRLKGVFAEDLVQRIEKALEHIAEVSGALREAGL